jgi:hypothetical protein
MVFVKMCFIIINIELRCNVRVMCATQKSNIELRWSCARLGHCGEFCTIIKKEVLFTDAINGSYYPLVMSCFNGLKCF